MSWRQLAPPRTSGKLESHVRAQLPHSKGESLLQGEAVPQNSEGAIELWRRAASKGESSAQYLLAQCFENGMGVAKDYLEARRLFTLAFGARTHTSQEPEIVLPHTTDDD